MHKGSTATVKGLGGHPELRARLQELGFVPGSQVTMVAAAAFGGALAFQVRGSTVALRRADAATILV
jgi:Fe2+ transport system protein FeoA